MKRLFVLMVVPLLFAGGGVYAKSLPRVKPQAVGIDPERLKNADAAIEQSIENGETPGAVLAVVRDGKLAYLKAYGNKQNVPDVRKMTTDTVFDLASVSKAASTSIAVMILVERGLLRLQDRVVDFIPDFEHWTDDSTGQKKHIRIIDLLTHTSGLPPYVSVAEFKKNHDVPDPQGLMSYIGALPKRAQPGTVFDYSCLNMITLQNVIEKISGENLHDFTRRNIYVPLKMKNTGYMPVGEMLEHIAPTQIKADGTQLIGIVHDPIAQVLIGGISGNAGLFSNAEDLAVLAAMLLNGGEVGGVRILSPMTVKAMRSVPEGYEKFGRSLGWDVFSAYASNQGDLFGKTAYGHTGYTGTSLIIDPDSGVAVILLTNRVYPYDETSITRLRGLVANAVAGAIVK